MNAYDILGVSSDANTADIKKAYRRLAMEYHPDRNSGAEAEAKFKQVSEAYDILSSNQKRAQHDAELHMRNNRHTNRGDPIFDHFFRNGGFGNFEDIFGPGGFQQRPYMERATATVSLTLEEAFHGARRVFSIDNRQVEVHIPSGVIDGEQLGVRVENRLHLSVKVRVRPHSIFTREGEDLYCKIEVPLLTAVSGGEIQVPSITGTARLKIPKMVNSHTRLRVKETGMRRDNRRGSTYYEVKLNLQSIDSIDANLLAGIFSRYSES